MDKEPITSRGLEKLKKELEELKKIKEIEIAWINNSFKITDKQIEKIING